MTPPDPDDDSEDALGLWKDMDAFYASVEQRTNSHSPMLKASDRGGQCRVAALLSQGNRFG